MTCAASSAFASFVEAVWVFFDDVGERAALHELHDDIGAPVKLSVVIEAGDRVVRERGGMARLGAETLEVALFARELFAQNLDGNGAVELLVLAFPDLAHATRGNEASEFVASFENESFTCFHAIPRSLPS